MKLLSLLEKNKTFWALLILCVIFFLLRLPSIIEPLWYGDEGIYQVIGQAMNNGQLIYKDIWDNKPPLLYILYAFANGDQTILRTLSLAVGLLSVIAFFFLAQKLFSSLKVSIITSSIYVLLFGTPFLEGNIANAENFILLPVILAASLIYSHTQDHKTKRVEKLSLFIAGIFLGVAFLFKIVALFDTVAFTLFLLFLSISKVTKSQMKTALIQILPLVIGFSIPFIISTIYFASLGIVSDYLQSVFARNVDYVGFENYLFGIPQGLLIVKILLLFVVTSIVFIKRNKFSPLTLFVILWTIFALFSAYFSGRPYTHYVLVLLPSFCLLIGLAFKHSKRMPRNVLPISIIAMSIIIALSFPLYGVTKSFEYYQNVILFLTNQRDLRSYQSFFDQKTPRDYALASFINNHTEPSDKIFIWGDSPQIYALSNKLPPYKYVVAYHVIQSPELLRETQIAIDTIKPKYIIVLPETQPLPFNVPLYIIRFNVEGAVIYERSI